MGAPGEINVEVTETPEGQLFFNLQQTDFEDAPSDIDGIFFDLAEDSELTSLNVFPDENTRDVTDIQNGEDSASALPNGASAGGDFDVGLQFGTVPDSSEGDIISTNFTIWSDDGPVTADDIDLQGMRVVVDSDDGNGTLLGVGESAPALTEPVDPEPTVEDIMALMTDPVEETAEDPVPDDTDVLIF